MSDASIGLNKLGFRPLYQQVRELFMARISEGIWPPAHPLPSEQALADELGVSQGTVRKALDTLVADNLVSRRQGKGTYVSQHTQESAHFRFFKLTHDSGESAIPASRDTVIHKRRSTPQERRDLDLPARGQVFDIRRTRLVDAKPVAREHICVSARLFEGLDQLGPLPNTLYALYQSDFGVSVAGATEQLKACRADEAASDALGVPLGEPLLRADRIARDIAKRPVERRSTVYLTNGFYYGVELG